MKYFSTMRIYIICFAMHSLSSVTFGADNVVHHPAPKEPVFVNTDLYPKIKAKVAAPPQEGSAAQKRDEDQLYAFQKKRLQVDCDAAKSEVLVSLASFFGAAGSPLKKADIDRLSPFFEQLRNDSDYFIQRLKVDFPRKRPFLYLKDLTPCVPKEVTGAYPSGHATIAAVYARVLTDLFPQHKTYFTQRANIIAEHRVLAGMHHPSDIEAGATLGSLIYQEFKKSSKYRETLETARKS